MPQKHKEAISRALKGHPTSPETRAKIGAANRGIWVDFDCDYCGKQNSEKQSHFKRKRRHFCDHTCYCKYREEILPPHEHNGWKGGITRLTQRGRGSKRYKQWQREVLARDKVCVWCGSSEKLEADHIKRWSTHLELRYEVSNGRTLCMKCHNKTRNKLFDENPELLN